MTRGNVVCTFNTNRQLLTSNGLPITLDLGEFYELLPELINSYQGVQMLLCHTKL